MSVSLTGPSGSVVFSGTWQSTTIPCGARGTVKCLLPTSDKWVDFAHTPIQTEGYMTFDGCYRKGAVCKMVGEIVPGSAPPTGSKFTTSCGGGNCFEMTVVSAGTDTVTLNYQSYQPRDSGIMTLTKESDVTSLSFTPNIGKIAFLGML